MRKQTEQKIQIEIGQEFLLTIKKLGINGEGVGFYKHQVVFVENALPHEEVVVQVTKVYEKHCQAKIVRMKTRSPQRIKSACFVFDRCGGCQLHHLDYQAQLIEKRDIVIQALLRHSTFTEENVEVRDCIGMTNWRGYRNKSQFQLGENNEGELLAGLYARDSHELIDINHCAVQHPLLNRVTWIVKTLLRKYQVPAYDEKRKSGIVRAIVARVSFATGEVQLTLVTISEKLPKKRQLIAEINQQLPEVVSIFQNVNQAQTPLIFGEQMIHLWGKDVIVEQLGTLSFTLSPRTFFQLNPIQTVRLYDEVKRAAKLIGKENVVDAYCGVGTIALWLADEAAEIRGMDTIPASIIDAKANAKRNGKRNLQFEVGRAEEILPKWQRKGFKADVIVVDPPRTGLDRKFIDTVLKMEPKRMVYVSCNPSTLARDLEIFRKKYKVNYIQPIDMFPMTSHVECCSLLVRK